MKKRAFVTAIFVLVIAALYFVFRPHVPTPGAVMVPENNSAPGSASGSSPVSGGTTSSISTSQPSTSLAPSNRAAEAGQLVVDTTLSTNLPAETLMQNVRHAVRQYGEMFGGNPVGNNAEITRALNGGNPKHAQFINPAAGMQISPDGELIDAWGTPYFFHQLSGTDMEIHSAGPDKRMWTSDDLIVR